MDVINTAIDTRVLPSIKNAVRRQNSAKNTFLDLRSDGLHQDYAAQENSQKDLRSKRLHPENANKSAQDAQNEFPRLILIKSNQKIVVERFQLILNQVTMSLVTTW